MAILSLDIIALEILPRLPPKTLLRLKSVNNFFYNYISSKKFINLHAQHPCSSNQDRLVMVFFAPRSNKSCLYFVDVDLPDSPVRYLPLPPSFCSCDVGILNVVGSCHGLLCLNTRYFNPNDKNYKTVEWIVLNPCTGKVSANMSMCHEACVQVCSGFGYDSLNDDYKLVVVEYHSKLYYDNANGINTRKVRVYSMKADSWSCVDDTSLCESEFKSSHRYSTCVLVGSHLMHWFLKHVIDGNKSIVCFNLEKGQWEADVALPKFVDHYRLADLGVLDGCLCLSVSDLELKSENYIIWIMKEYGVQESWTKLSIEVPQHCYRHPIFPIEKGLSTIEEVLFTKKKYSGPVGDKTYVLYNIRDKTSRKLELSCLPCDNVMVLSWCLGSLVTGVRDGQTDEKRKATQKEPIMKNDIQFEFIKAAMINNHMNNLTIN